MLTEKELEENGRQFMLELYRQTNGDPAKQLSMYVIGAGLGLDKSDSSRVTEPLIGNDWVEIRSLSGGISITAEGVAEVRQLLGESASPGGVAEKLGQAAVLDDHARRSVEKVTVDLKHRLTQIKLEFDTLADVVTDLRTMDIQLTSSKPRTAIIRACFESIMEALAKSDAAAECVARIEGLLKP